MNVSVGERWERWIEALLSTGRYGSVSEIVREGLRLVEEREERARPLREHLEASIARGGARSGDEVMASVRAALDKWEAGADRRDAA